MEPALPKDAESEDDRIRHGALSAPTKGRVPRRKPRRSSSSKYDYVKVHVQLEGHSYVLSRFLVNRVLNVTKVDYEDAIQISLELKRRLVDGDRLTISHTDLEKELFEIMKDFGYADEFHHQRIPLIILMCGTACIGKSVLATQLAERLNLPSVLQTRLIYEVMQHSNKCFDETPVYFNKVFSRGDPIEIYEEKKNRLIETFKKECSLVRTGVNGDIEKCLMEGKAIIVEGFHLDPGQFMDLIHTGVFIRSNGCDSISFTAPSFSGESEPSSNGLNGLVKSDHRLPAVVIPFVFSLGETDRRAFLEDWISHNDPSIFRNTDPNDDHVTSMLQNYGVIQDYLKQFASKVNTVNMSAVTLQETVSALHDTVLNTIKAFFVQQSAA